MTEDPTLLSGAAAPAGWVQLGKLIRQHGQAFALNLRAEKDSLEWRHTVPLVVLHVVGLLAIARVTRQPVWLLALPVLLALPAVLSIRTRTVRPLLESLAPLSIAYTVVIARACIEVAIRRSDPVGSASIPEPWAHLLDVNLAALLGVVWALAAQAALLAEVVRSPLRTVLRVGPIVIAGSVVWAASTYVSMRAAGVTASDPYGYTQMAVDIATSGLPIHRFTDVPDVVSWGLSPWPLVPVGYDVPHALTGASTSVWPPGFSAFMAFAFRLGGESAMYLIPPVFGITALLASIWLCWEVLHSWPPARRLLVAGIAVYLVGTSFLQLELAVKPASDVAAQTFVVAAICLALASRRLRRYRLAVLAGLSLGVAFTMRYELVVIAVPLAFVFLQGAGGRHVSRTDRRAGADRGWQGVAPSRNWSVRALLCCAGAAWIPTLPIFAYHLVAYGHPFAVPSSELPLIAPANMLETAGPVAADFFSSNHFLYVVPFVVVGLAVLWRERRCHALLFLVWMTVIVLVHLPYLATDVRHLLPIFPAVSLIAAVGSIHLLQSVARLATKPSGSGRWDPGSGRWDLAAMLTWSAVWVVTLTATLIALYARADLAFASTDPSRSSFRAFGYLHANQRVAFDTLAAVTPPDAFVATTLNAGPIELYARRHPVRPSAWTAQEWALFLDRAMTEHRNVFLLLDGDELKQPLERARSSHPVTYVTTLPAHYFAPDAGSIDADVDLFQIGP